MRQLCGKCAQLKTLDSTSLHALFLYLVWELIKLNGLQSIQSVFHFLSLCLSDIYVCSLTPSIHLMQHFTISIHAAASLEGSLFCTTAAKHTARHLTGKSSTENSAFACECALVCGHASACDHCEPLLKSDG